MGTKSQGADSLVQNRKSTAVRWLSLGLALIFLAAGVGKIFVFVDFSITVAGITYLSLATAKVFAGSLIALEVTGALALIFRKRVVLVSVLFCGLIAAFMWVLTMAVIRGREINCNCFGILDLSLPNAGELVLDVILFNLFALLAYLAIDLKRPVDEKPKRGRQILRFGSLIVVLLLEYSLISPILAKSLPSGKVDLGLAVDYAEGVANGFTRYRTGERLILLMNYADLSCPVCFEDFSAFSDSLSQRFGEQKGEKIIVIFKADEFSGTDSSSHLQRWAAANNLDFPIYVAPDSLFKKMNFVKSMAIVVDKGSRVAFSSVFPMGERDRKLVLELLSTK